MRHRSRAWPLLLLPLTMCPSISRQELACEEAKARLVRCCPGFTGERLFCEDTTGEVYGCNQVEIGLADARCVTDRSCGALAQDGTCARALANWGPDTPTSPFNASICLP